MSKPIEIEDLQKVTQALLTDILGNVAGDKLVNDAFTPKDGSLLSQLTKNVDEIEVAQQKEIELVGDIARKIEELGNLYRNEQREVASLKQQKEIADSATKKKLGKDVDDLKLHLSSIKKVIAESNAKLRKILDSNAQPNTELTKLDTKLGQIIKGQGTSAIAGMLNTSLHQEQEKPSSPPPSGIDHETLPETGGRKSRKHRKSRKSRKHRKSRKSRKSRKGKKGGWKPSKSHRHRSPKRRRTRKH